MSKSSPIALRSAALFLSFWLRVHFAKRFINARPIGPAALNAGSGKMGGTLCISSQVGALSSCLIHRTNAPFSQNTKVMRPIIKARIRVEVAIPGAIITPMIARKTVQLRSRPKVLIPKRLIIWTIIPRDYMPDTARSRNAGLASRIGQKCSQVPSAAEADPRTVGIRSANRSDLHGRDRARQTKSQSPGNGQNCGCTRSTVGRAA